MDADEGSTPVVSGGIYNQSPACQTTTTLTPSPFWNKKPFIWNTFNSVLCLTGKPSAYGQPPGARDPLRCGIWPAILCLNL